MWSYTRAPESMLTRHMRTPVGVHRGCADYGCVAKPHLSAISRPSSIGKSHGGAEHHTSMVAAGCVTEQLQLNDQGVGVALCRQPVLGASGVCVGAAVRPGGSFGVAEVRCPRVGLSPGASP